MPDNRRMYIFGGNPYDFFGPSRRGPEGIPVGIMDRMQAQNHLCGMQNEMLNRLDEENQRLSAENKALRKEIMRLQAMIKSVSAHASLLEEICEENHIDISDYMGDGCGSTEQKCEQKPIISENPLAPSEDWWEHILALVSEN